MRIRSKSANTYNVICEDRVIKVFKYRKAAQRWIDQMTIPAHIEVVPVGTPSEGAVALSIPGSRRLDDMAAA